MAAAMEISNPDRIVYPEDGLTKGDVCAYFALVTDRLFPFVESRALTVERYPKGLSGKGFMQKNAPSHFGEDLIRRYPVPKEDGGTTTYPVVTVPTAIVAYANLGVLTFHVPPVRVESGWQPDWIIWDLDPSEGDLGRVREAAEVLREVLEGFSIPTVVLASGSKGYHLRAQIDPNLTHQAIAGLARGVAALAVAAHPDLLTLAFRKSERGKRVFVDWLRNAALSTAVAPWSLGPRSRAPVAFPLAWSQLHEIAPDGVTLREAAGTSEHDPWRDAEPIDLTEQVTLVARTVEEAGIVLEPFDRFRS